MDINWRQLWTALGVVFVIVAGTVSITLAITSSQISGLERSQAQQAENILALMNAQNESVLAQLRLLNDKMNNIETEHAELRSLYERVGELRSDVNHIKDDVCELQSDVKTLRANQDAMRADLDTMRADIDKILTILEDGE